MRISPEAIYQSLYVQGRGALRREMVACLRTGRGLRVPRARSRRRGKSFIVPKIMISERPAEVADRAVPGHWEGDLILGLESSAIGTVVEPNKYQDLLVIRPWVSSYSSGGTFGHFDAVAMRRLGATAPQHYCDLEMLQAGEDGRKVLFLDRFRFECQVDERKPEPYCWRWGYSPANCSMFTTRDLDRFGKSIRAIDRGLGKLEGAGGAPGSVGSFIARLATVLSVDGIVTLELTPTRTFGGHLAVRHRAMAPQYGGVIAAIDGLAAELQAACAARALRC